jgi:hypothetical protein
VGLWDSQLIMLKGNSSRLEKDLGREDLLSPLLFNLVVDVMSRMMQKATSEGLIRGLLSDLVPGGVINLQYADDTILFVDKEISYADNLKCILTCFELM